MRPLQLDSIFSEHYPQADFSKSAPRMIIAWALSRPKLRRDQHYRDLRVIRNTQSSTLKAKFSHLFLLFWTKDQCN